MSSHQQEGHGTTPEVVVESERNKTSLLDTGKNVSSAVATTLKAVPTMLPAVTYAGLFAGYGSPDGVQSALMLAGLLAEIFKSYKAVDNTTLQRLTGWTFEACNALFAFWLTIQNIESTAMKFALAAAIINLVVRGVTREEILKRDIGHS